MPFTPPNTRFADISRASLGETPCSTSNRSVSTVLSAIDAGCKVIYLTDAVAGLSEASRTETEKIVSYFAPLHTELMTTEEYLTHSKPLL